MNPDLCSVIIPIYNGSKYLVETIESTLSQNYSPIEIILVNDASTDKSADIISHYRCQYDDVVRTVNHNENKGLVQAFLSGVKASKGEYISCFGQDDIMFPERLSTLIRALLKHQVSMVCSNAYYLYDDYQTADLVRPLLSSDRFISRYMFRYTNPVIGPSALFRKSDFLNIDQSIFRFKQSMERIHWYQYTNMKGIYYLANPLLYYRRHQSNMSSWVFISPENSQYRAYCAQFIAPQLTFYERISAIRTYLLDKIRNKFLTMRD